MRPHDGSERECERYWNLADREKSGELLGADDAAVLRKHVRSCPDCAADAALRDLATELESEPDAASATGRTDEGGRERWVEEVLRRVREGDGDGTGDVEEVVCREESVSPRGPDRGTSPGIPRWAPWAAAAGVLVAAGLTTIYLTVGHETPSRTSHEQPPPAPTVSTLFLAAGSARVGDVAARAGEAWSVGSTIEVAGGRVGITLCGACLFLDAGAHLRLIEQDTDQCGVRLAVGRIAADARGLRTGAELVVATAAGDVRVTGTIFAVEVAGAGAEARVLEGSVEVLSSPRAARTVRASEALRLGDDGVRRLSEAEVERDRRLAEWLPRDGGVPTSLLEVWTDAAAAEVEVDGVALGPAPVTALVAPGRREIALRGPGASLVGETVTLEAGERFERRYLSRPDGPAAGTASEALEATRPVVATAPGVGSADRAGTTTVGRSGGGPEAGDRASAKPAAAERTAQPGATPPPTRAAPGESAAMPPIDVPTASGLLADARRRRAAGDWAGAAAAYEELAERFPDSGEARATLVPLGQLRLERLDDPTGALRAFDAYLTAAPSGPLGEEASWGRVRALRQLGRAAEEAESLRSFVAGHPASLRAEEARRRLGELEGEREP